VDPCCGSGRLAEIQSCLHVRWDGGSLSLGFGNQPQFIPLEPTKFLFPATDILSQGNQLFFKRLGNVIQKMALTKLMGSPRQGLRDSGGQAGFFVRNNPDDWQIQGRQLADDKVQARSSPAPLFPSRTTGFQKVHR